jgi:hypothetical protein
MSNLSRRHLVTSAVAVPALAMPATVALAREPDPIFAAIREYIAADKAYLEACSLYGDAEEAFRAEFGSLSPDGVSKELRVGLATIAPALEGATLSSHKAIDEFVKGCNLDQDVAAGLHEELDFQRAAHRDRVIPKEEAQGRTCDNAHEARERLIATQPTTLAGLAALLRVSLENDMMRFTIDDDAEPLLKALSTAADALAVQS